MFYQKYLLDIADLLWLFVVELNIRIYKIKSKSRSDAVVQYEYI